MGNLIVDLVLADTEDFAEPNVPPVELLADRLGISVEMASDLLTRYANDLDSVMRHVAAVV